jgi:hypothetical protein
MTPLPRCLARLALLGGAALAGSLLYACAQSAPAGFAPDAGAPGDDAATTEAGLDASLVGDGGSRETGPGCTKQCSPDLHQVLSCDDPPHVLVTCPPDQGCGPAFTCIAACDAAAGDKSAVGCDYYSVPTDGYSKMAEFDPTAGADGSCFAAFVTNTWSTPMHATLEWNGQQLDAAGYAYIAKGSGANIQYVPLSQSGGAIQPGQVAIVFLSEYGGLNDDAGVPNQDKILCPAGVQVAFTSQDIAVHGTGLGHAVHITTDVPAVVYDIFPFGGAASYISSATLLLPTDTWDTNYVAVTAWPGYALQGGLALPSGIDVVAMQDQTTVTLLPTAAVDPRGGVAGGAVHQPETYTLDRGQQLHVMQVADLSGSPIQADHPVGVWGGHYCMQIPGPGQPACDAAHQQTPPVKALGSRYAAVQYRSRVVGEEKVPWRIMGMVKDTQLKFDPPVSGAPATLQVGQLVEFWTDQQFVVSSQDDQHPFYLAAHMTGGTLAADGKTGDPETVNVVPPAQYLSSYVFFTDPTYSETNLVLVRDQAADGLYKDVTLDCLGSPVSGWKTIGGSTLQFARVDLQHMHAAVAACDNGAHQMKSDAPFGVTVWGYDDYVSYAYPAGASLRPINHVVVPPVPQ